MNPRTQKLIADIEQEIQYALEDLVDGFEIQIWKYKRFGKVKTMKTKQMNMKTMKTLKNLADCWVD